MTRFIFCSHGSPRMIDLFPSPVTRNVSLLLLPLISISFFAQCVMVPFLVWVPSTFHTEIGFMRGWSWMLFSSANWWSIKIPPAPLLRRAFISMSFSLSVPTLISKCMDQFSKVASSTEQTGSSAVPGVASGRFFKNPLPPLESGLFLFLLHLSLLRLL
jgi:hypothetical protein